MSNCSKLVWPPNLTVQWMQARSSHLGDGRSSAGLANPLSGVSDDDWSISAWISFTLSLKAFLVVFELLKTTTIATNLAFLRNAAWLCHVHVTWTQPTYIPACGFIVSRDARSRQHQFSSFSYLLCAFPRDFLSLLTEVLDEFFEGVDFDSAPPFFCP